MLKNSMGPGRKFHSTFIKVGILVVLHCYFENKCKFSSCSGHTYKFYLISRNYLLSSNKNIFLKTAEVTCGCYPVFFSY